MRKLRIVMVTSMSAALAACSMAPDYHPPLVSEPSTFKEMGPWVAVSTDTLPSPARWWKLFEDPVLDGLEQKVATGNPSLQAALSRYRLAQAYLGEIHSDLLPHIGANAELTQNRQSNNRPLRGSNQPDFYAADTLGGTLDWDLDFWGKLRNRVAAGRAEVAASADDLAAARLATEAQLALQYVQLRGLDAQTKLLQATVDAYREADDLTQRRFRGGIASGVDTARSGTQLADARAQLADVAAARALIEHAIASLVGESASGFSLAPADNDPVLPDIPMGIPSTVLQRRPDIAAAERRMFAANAQIGAAKAAFYPSVSLGGSTGVQDTGFAGLISAPNTFWSIGPAALLSIFDGGRRRAQLAASRAKWAEATADYRHNVLQAFQDVEDALAQLHHFADEAQAQQDAVRMAGDAEKLALNRYVKGAVTYLEVSTAQATALQARRAMLDLHTRQLQAGIRLVRATGGGWNS